MTVPARVRVPGRGWAYTGAIGGGVASIAANVAHSFIPPHGTQAGWTPEAGAVVGAIVWPVFLFVAVEILARTAWPAGRIWHLLRWGGLVPVAVVAAFVSYRHLSGLLAHYGEEPIVTWLGPLAVDGLMVMATGALLATGRHHTTTETESVTTSVPVPVAAPNTVRRAPATPIPMPVPAPSTVDLAPSHVDSDPTEPAPQTAPEPVTIEIPTPADLAARITTPRPTSDRPTPAAAPRAAARPRRTRPTSPSTPAPQLAPSTTDTHVTVSDAAQLTLPVVPSDLLARADQVARQYRTEHGTPITAGQLAARLKVNSDLASQALAVLDLGPNSPTQPIPTVNGTPVKATR